MPGTVQPFRASGDGNVDRAIARVMFLRAVEHRAPQFVRDLETLSPPWVALAATYPGTITLDAVRQISPVLHPAKILSDALGKWAETKALHRDDWILEAALKYLGTLDSSTATARDPFGASAFVGYWTPAPTLAAPQYRPDVETWEQYIGSERMASYRAEIESSYRANGWDVGKDRQQAERHLGWLVQFQVLGERYAAIAHGALASPKTVRREVGHFAKLLGLTLREDRRVV